MTVCVLFREYPDFYRIVMEKQQISGDESTGMKEGEKALTTKEPVWEPSQERIQNSNITRFIKLVNERFGLTLNTYNELQRWSVENVPDFWALIWEFGEVRASVPYETPVTGLDDMLGVQWCPGARFNFAENLLRYRDDRTALVFKGEGQEKRRISYSELYDQVSRLAQALKQTGVGIGDRVAGFLPNMPEAVIAMLATTSLGAIWSSCSPDFGVRGMLDRFQQIEPKVLFTANGYVYNGKTHDSLERVASVLGDIPSIEKVVVIPYTEQSPDISSIPGAYLFEDFMADEVPSEIQFEQLPFDHPIYIVYSSGTTDKPKCVVHRAGGILLQHLKELMLNTDLKREDTIFYFTTCGWVMWNWLVSSLTQGATIVLYDGSPFASDNRVLLDLVQDEKATIWGTSPKYLSTLEKAGVVPGSEYDLSNVKTMVSTGSPLMEENYRYVYRDIKPDVFLNNISGGTEAIACFGIGNPISPIYVEEMQGLGLAMDVHVFDENGRSLVEQEGELVCARPFPSMPLRFWNDDNFQRYRDTYFSMYPNIWRHGDFAKITDTGGLVISGRSDATLKPGGVRIGTAEIYRQVETVEEVQDSVVIGQNWDNDVRIILFVKLVEGYEFNEALVQKIRTVIRNNASPRHVPGKIIPVADIPYTINGKKVELAVRNMVHGTPVKNRDALANPEALDLYKDLEELKS
ncbi:MAG: acetoacetate--CoA ligase [Dehalococcoidales bacterium]|nr:acetoacetate--CoA ligase [Dehalococcoidales bacterium]